MGVKPRRLAGWTRRRAGPLLRCVCVFGAVATLGIGFAGASVAAVAGVPLITITFGSAYEAAATLLPQILAASTLIGVLFILVNHHVARSDHRFAWALAVLAGLHVVLLITLGVTANAIIAIDAGVAVLAIVVHEVIYRGTADSLIAGVRAARRRPSSGGAREAGYSPPS